MTKLQRLKDAKSLGDLAQLLGVTPKGLSYIIYKLDPAVKYSQFQIPKSNGQLRDICAPCEQLKLIQSRLAELLYSCVKQIEYQENRKPLSHGFTKGRSIYSNAKCHKNRRFVLNFDLLDFFPSFNFGRVRGFLIQNRDFRLHEKVATTIAQIACFEDELPQGSPCSPVIANLIAHILDIGMAKLAYSASVTYSRYADDITFSTNKKNFPESIARPLSGNQAHWVLGDELLKLVKKNGFEVNDPKTRMHYKSSRQLVNGLTVNRKVNIRSEYYKNVRAMCHSLFETDAYSRTSEDQESGITTNSLAPLQGMLSYIHYVKDLSDLRHRNEKADKPTAFVSLYRKFLAYRYFVRSEKPLIVGEGITDTTHLKYAIKETLINQGNANTNRLVPPLGLISGVPMCMLIPLPVFTATYCFPSTAKVIG